MDESINGESTLRLMKTKLNKKHKSSNNSFHLNLLKLWQLTLLFSISGYLGFFFITKTTEPFNKSSISIEGEHLLNKEQIIKAMRINLPTTLLKVNPKQIQKNLQAKLPIKAVAINRRILPLGIDVKILERVPVALAFKTGKDGNKKGMLDKNGNWIQIDNAEKPLKHLNKIIFDGWTESNSDLVALILRDQSKLDLSIKRVIFNSDGNITLQTKEFLFVYLGNQPNLISQQIEAIAHLSNSLPNQFLNKPGLVLDIKNPNKPKLFLEEQRD